MILWKRFGNKPLIISKHMETLLTAEPVTSDKSLKELRHLYDKTESHLRSLKSLGVEPTSYRAMLSPVLLTKLPPELRLVSRTISSTDLNMDNLLEMFEVLVARERASSSRTSRAPPRRSQARKQSSALLTKAQEAGSGPICCYCQQPHTSADSITVSNITARKQILRSSSRCFNCLREGHQAGARSAVDVITPPYVRKPLNRLKGHPAQPSHNQGWIQLPPNTSRFRL